MSYRTLMNGLRDQRKKTGIDIIIRDKIISTAVEVFKRHGAIRMDTPFIVSGDNKEMPISKAPFAFELRARLRLLESIRRWVERKPSVKSTKCYMIGESVRHDPSFSWEDIDLSDSVGNNTCDMSIVGVYESMLPDAEILNALIEILEKSGVEGYKIRINHRRIIDGIFECCGVDRDGGIPELISSLRLKKEFQSEDHLRIEIERLLRAEKQDYSRSLSQHLSRKGGRHLQYDLLLEEELIGNASFSNGLREIGILFDYLEIFGIMDKIEFDLSFTHNSAQTGIVFMAIAPVPIPESSLGTSQIVEIAEDFDEIACLATGGRDDSNREDGVQLVYFSLYANEVMNIIKERIPSQKEIRISETEVYVMSFGEGLLKERMQVCKKLWSAGIKTEFSYQKKPELPYQMAAARRSGIPFAIILSEDYLQQRRVKIVDLSVHESHPQRTGVDIYYPDLVAEIKQRLKGRPGRKEVDEVEEDTDIEDGRENDSGIPPTGGNQFKENVKRVRLEGGTVDMEGIEIEMDFAKITSKDTQIEVQGAKIKMNNAKIELRGSKE